MGDGKENAELLGTELDDSKDNVGGEAEEKDLPAEGLAEEAEDEPGEPGAAEVGQPATKQTEGRASRAIQELKKERNEERERAARYEAQLQRLMETQAQQVAAQNGQTEQQRVAEMDPTDRVAYLANKQAEYMQNQISRLEFQVKDGQDQARFQAQAAIDPLYAKYSDKVEKALAEMRSKGTTAEREKILKYFVGEEVVEKRTSAGIAKIKEAAAQRVAAATGKPIGARGEINGGKKGKTAEERLEGIII